MFLTLLVKCKEKDDMFALFRSVQKLILSCIYSLPYILFMFIYMNINNESHTAKKIH